MEFNKIYHGDCVEGLKSMPDNIVDLVVTSPPYNLNIDYAHHKDDMKLEAYYNWCREWISECYRVLFFLLLITIPFLLILGIKTRW